MQTPSIGKLAAIIVLLIVGVAALVARGKIALPEKGEETFAAVKKKRRNYMVAGVLCLWVFSGLVLGLFGTGEKKLTVSISPSRVDIFGVSTSSTVVVAWIVMAALILFAVIVRIFFIPKFQEAPRGLQSVLEIAVGAISDFTKDKFGHKNETLAAYFFALAALLLGSVIVELLGLRPPTTDLTMTFSYALITFLMINYYGIKKKGVAGRVQSLMKPNAIIFPFRLLSDIAVPISLACRLFGNMLGGMVVVDLLYYSMGAFSVGVPAVLGLYFNAFHPLIQFFIFINLSLTFIGEAVE